MARRGTIKVDRLVRMQFDPPLGSDTPRGVFDDIIKHIEDWMHGPEGQECTEARGKLQKVAIQLRLTNKCLEPNK